VHLSSIEVRISERVNGYDFGKLPLNQVAVVVRVRELVSSAQLQRCAESFIPIRCPHEVDAALDYDSTFSLDKAERPEFGTEPFTFHREQPGARCGKKTIGQTPSGCFRLVGAVLEGRTLPSLKPTTELRRGPIRARLRLRSGSIGQ
jgi:hypothetical protein